VGLGIALSKKACFFISSKKACFFIWERMMAKCTCGSQRQADPVYDGHGIFLCYTCTRCHNRRMRRFRPDIMQRYDADEQIEPDE
jgi:hypothetical protein